MASLYFVTPQEMEILLALFQPENEKPISAEMFMSEKLVELYLEYIPIVLDMRRLVEIRTTEQRAYNGLHLFQ
jgi:hypothetical protein